MRESDGLARMGDPGGLCKFSAKTILWPGRSTAYVPFSSSPRRAVSGTGGGVMTADAAARPSGFPPAR